MTDGLRERKKQQTRRALADAALRLFDQHGYDATTVADIAAAANVSTRTFFGYYPSKDDVLFADTDERLALLNDATSDITATPSPDAALRRLIDAIAGHAAEHLRGPAGATRRRILMQTPELQARALQRLTTGQQHIANLLRAAHPQLHPADTLAMSGAIIGALLTVALHHTDPANNATTDDMRHAMRRTYNAIEHGFTGPREQPAQALTSHPTLPDSP